MATAYGMGQIRYTSAGGFATDETESWTGEHFYKNGVVGGYKDFRIKTSNLKPIEQGDIYLLHCDIARNSTYNMIFDLKLCNTDSTYGLTDSDDYQNIKRFTVGKDATGSVNTLCAILFDDNFNNTDVKIVENYYDKQLKEVNKSTKKLFSTSDLNKNRVYRGREINGSDEDYYFYYRPYSGPSYPYGWIRILNYNLQFISESWKQNQSSAQKASFDFIIKNSLLNSNLNNFNSIVFDMVRQDWDNDITNKEGTEEFKGLKANIDFEIYKITDILTTEKFKGKSPFSTIGVWGHPDLIMAINGEEIRVGQSGYYELTDFDITSLGIAAVSDKDRFTLDYQYKLGA